MLKLKKTIMTYYFHNFSTFVNFGALSVMFLIKKCQMSLHADYNNYI